MQSRSPDGKRGIFPAWGRAGVAYPGPPMPEPMPRSRQWAYCLGNGGFQISEQIVVSVALFFYLPPEAAGLDLVPQISDEVFFGVVTVFGLAGLVGRVVDSAADPVVGFASDRSRSRFGRRRAFLIYGIVPMVAIPVLLFYPPGEPESVANAVWFTALYSLYFISFTVYVAPYLALFAEISWSQEDRVWLSRALAFVAFPVAVFFASGWALGFDAGRAAGLDSVSALRWLVVVSSLVAFALCLAPIAAVDEHRYARSIRSDLSLGPALRATLANRPFMIYLAAQILFVFGVNMIRPAMPYIATVLLGRSPGFAAWLTVAMAVGIVGGFFVVNRLTNRFGAKRVMMGCITAFSLALASLFLIEPDVPGGARDAVNLAIVFGSLAVVGVPVVAFLVIPHVLMGQLIDADAAKTGANRSAMFFGTQGLLTKWVYGASAWMLSYLLAEFGRSPEDPLGVQLVGPVAGLACLLSVVLYAFYPEQELLREGERAPEG